MTQWAWWLSTAKLERGVLAWLSAPTWSSTKPSITHTKPWPCSIKEGQQMGKVCRSPVKSATCNTSSTSWRLALNHPLLRLWPLTQSTRPALTFCWSQIVGLKLPVSVWVHLIAILAVSSSKLRWVISRTQTFFTATRPKKTAKACSKWLFSRPRTANSTS